MRSDEFYFFMREREAVRLRKEAGDPWPWTKDEILQSYKFTNVKREHDKTTRKLRELYEQAAGPAELHNGDFNPAMHLMNCATYRYFGTWEFAWALGYMTEWDPGYVRETAYERQAQKLPVFTGAYVVTNQGIRAPKIDVVTNLFLTPLHAVSEQIVNLIEDTRSWRAVIEAMSNVQGFGGTGFMSKEVVLDTLFTPLWGGRAPDDFNTWCPAGPGARRGLNRVHGRPVDKSIRAEQALEEMATLFAMRYSLWPEDGVPLVLHDIQFQLCEWDKYERVRLGEGKPRSRYRAPAQA